MATITITKLHTLLSQKIGIETAESLTTFIEEKINEEVKDATTEIATKDFVGKAIAELETKLVSRIENGFNNQMRWMIGLIIVIVAMIVGLYFKK